MEPVKLTFLMTPVNFLWCFYSTSIQSCSLTILTSSCAYWILKTLFLWTHSSYVYLMIKHISENTQQILRTTFEQSLSSPTGFPYCLCFLLPILEISSIFKLLPSAFLNLKVFFFFPLVAFLSLYLMDTWRLQGLSSGHASLSRSHLCLSLGLHGDEKQKVLKQHTV